jgi:hypothetical protein
LNLIPQPPIPNLKIYSLETVASVPSKDTEAIPAFNPGKMKREELNLHLAPSSTSSTATSSSGGDDAGFDEFTDFQSAVSTAAEKSSTIIKEQISTEKSPEIQSSTATMLPSDVVTTQKCPSVMVISSSVHGRGIGSRLANHSLGTPKQKKTKHHHHHHHHHRTQSQVTRTLDEDFSEFQQAKDPVSSTGNSGDATVDHMFPKCMVKTPQGKTYLLKESAIRAEMKLEGNRQGIGIVKDGGLTSSEGIQSDFDQRKSTGLLSEKSKPDGSRNDQNTALVGQHMEPEFRSKTSISCSVESKSQGVNLMSVEEDKYSALRNLSITGQDTSPEKPQLFISTDQSPASDDFGDFLSAEPAGGVDDSFADIATREQSSSKNLADLASVNTLKTADFPRTAEFQVDDDWGEYKGAPVCDISSNLNQILDVTGENKVGNTANKIKTETDISAVLMDLCLGNDSNNMWDPKDSDNGIAGDEKKKALDFLSLVEPSADANIGNSWDFKTKDDSNSHGDTSLNTSDIAGQSSTLQGFLGKIYGSDVKSEHYSVNVDILCSSPDDQLHGGRSDNFNIDMQNHDGDDDFGEFVGPDTWSDEQKGNDMTKDILFDSHLGQGLRDGLYGDSQSVSSLELPPLALSRHGSVPSLDLKIFPSTTDKNGGNGDNQFWDMSPQVCMLLTKEIIVNVLGLEPTSIKNT